MLSLTQPHNEGMTNADRKKTLGFKPLSAHERAQHTMKLDTTGFTPPATYDARVASKAQIKGSVFRMEGSGLR